MRFQKKAVVVSAGEPPAPPPVSPAGLQIEMWPISRPIPYARNARTLSARALDVIMSSLKEFGFRQPIVVDSAGVIIAGHTRLMGAKKLGMTEVPVHVAWNLTPGQCAAYRLMDNRSSQETSWDFELLAPELLDLKALDFDLALTGFDAPEIGKLLDAAAPAAEGDEPGGASGNSPVISYSIVFNTEEEQATWFQFLKDLRALYPEEAGATTIAERIIRYIEAHGPKE